MSINVFTLENLYKNGILDSVPYELCGGMPISRMEQLSNPYNNIVAEQKSGANTGQSDSFIRGNNSSLDTMTYTQQAGGITSNGAYGGDSFSANSYNPPLGQNNPYANNHSFFIKNNREPGLGLIGQEGNVGLSLTNNFDRQGNNDRFYNHSNSGDNFINPATKNLKSIFDSSPNLLKGVLSGLLLLGTLAICFKTKKKPIKQTKNSFLSKLNPMNLIRKIRK